MYDNIVYVNNRSRISLFSAVYSILYTLTWPRIVASDNSRLLSHNNIKYIYIYLRRPLRGEGIFVLIIARGVLKMQSRFDRKHPRAARPIKWTVLPRYYVSPPALRSLFPLDDSHSYSVI